MAELPGRGTGLLVLIAVGIGVVVALFLASGVHCDDTYCGEVEGPRAASPVAIDAPPSAPPSGPPSPAQPSPTGSPTDGTGTGDPGTPGLQYDTRIQNPGAVDPGSPDPGQAVGAWLRPGQLTVNPRTPGTGQGRLQVNTLLGVAWGKLDPLIVEDYRGSRSGWSLTATMSDFVARDGTRISADRLEWKPFCRPAPGSEPYPSKVVTGSEAAMSRTALLCSTPSLDTVTGGRFDVGADFTMRVPVAAAAPEDYTSVLLLTLT
ncbi:hypothetical protein [Yinghuangia soli]|uniref:Uncharacterized protein n=1 Tax=Yinghuangia soli TaxID=2908204 RepID=A0AA41Q9S3_9ACTN|nr:hypothetical protein [Yinghuangia soli]MCF2534023.1 hypothetical protein [Yinghuangia soli]